ncbi:hypothetical protein [Brevundimonas diminuta]|uniref:Uncharacterized protein n=1 Tax=Brevundimonas diminuta TaxID=293 RepID=A0A410NTG2_BREDI|nr:hypothetical protein [Brevundimonas diminuta]QAT13026.1 hypothetical protein EQG53_00900 [Brevundimonas diminuta]QQB89627.1 hypothetical protein I6H83_04065 [Brevundimonas diminuta]
MRDLYAREFMRVELIAEATDLSFEYDVAIKAFDNVTWANSKSTPVTVVREGGLLSDGDDDLYLATSTNGATIRLRDKDLEALCAAAGAGGVGPVDPAFAQFGPETIRGIAYPRSVRRLSGVRGDQ